MGTERWIILNPRLQKADRREFATAGEAQAALDKRWPNPFAKQQFFVAEAARYNY